MPNPIQRKRAGRTTARVDKRLWKGKCSDTGGESIGSGCSLRRSRLGRFGMGGCTLTLTNGLGEPVTLGGAVTAEIEHELRSTSDTLLATLEQLEQLETEKRTLPPDSDRFQKLAREIERLAAVIFAESHDQQQLGVRSKRLSQQQGVELDPIDEMTPARDVSVILGEWRAAERALADADPDTSSAPRRRLT